MCSRTDIDLSFSFLIPLAGGGVQALYILAALSACSTTYRVGSTEISDSISLRPWVSYLNLQRPVSLSVWCNKNGSNEMTYNLTHLNVIIFKEKLK